MKRFAKKASPEQIRERSCRKLRFAVLDARRAGVTTREAMEIAAKATEDWRFVNG